MTLRWRLTTAFVAVVVVPLVVATVLLWFALPNVLAREQASATDSASRLAGQVVAGLCDRARAAAEVAGRGVLAVPADATDAQEAALTSLVERGVADGLQVTDGAGRVVEAGALPAGTVACDGAPAGAAAGAGVAGLRAVVRLEQPDAVGSTEAVAVLTTVQALADRLGESVDGEVVLLSGEQVVASSDAAAEALVGPALAAPDGVATVRGQLGDLEPAAAGRPLGVLVVQTARSGIDLLSTAAVIVLVAALLAAGLARWLARATVRPLEELGQAAARVASGDLATTIDVRSHDEVGQLAGAFNSMTQELREHVGALEASRDELRAGLARLGQTLTSTHDLDRILAVVLETAMASTSARSGAVLLRETGGGLVLAAARGLPEGRVDVRVGPGEGAVGAALADGSARRVAVLDGEPSPLDPAAARLLAVPLRGTEQVLGVLVLHDPRTENPDDDVDQSSLETLADQAAVAVENVLQHRDVSRMAVTDALTGLANYRSFTATISRELERATRFGRPVGLLLLDIDHFKRVNDTLGHQRGDAVLVELARRVVLQVRDVDTVARYGGEELVVVLPETDVHGAEMAAERIRTAVAGQPFGEPPAVPVRVTVSLGVAVHGVHATTASELLRNADEALYAAKGAGRDAWRTATVSGAEPVAGRTGSPH